VLGRRLRAADARTAGTTATLNDAARSIEF
jgi:hypothetical protein